MLITLTTTHQPATDLGYLIGKNPARAQSFELTVGQAHVFYPEANAERCTVALLLDIDPVALVRGRGETIGHYVNDRPFVAASFMAVAIARILRRGESKERPELAHTAIPLEVNVPVLRCRAGRARIEAVLAPLGYDTVTIEALPLDSKFPEWGASPYIALRLAGTLKLSGVLSHLYVLLPALDGDKHYYVGSDEVQKLVDHAGPWLAAHPEREWITSRYLKQRRSLVREALSQLILEDEDDAETADQQRDEREANIERPLSLNEQRLRAVLEVLVERGAHSVVDVGCGEGRLLALLMEERRFDKLLGVDVSCVALERAADRLKLDRLPALQRARIELKQSSLTYRDDALRGFDAVVAVEVVEHIDAERLEAVQANLFGHAASPLVVVTTPNADYNVLFEALRPGTFRHGDHRFEWTRAEFAAWSAEVADRYDYDVQLRGIGNVDATLGTPTQMAVFKKRELP